MGWGYDWGGVHREQDGGERVPVWEARIEALGSFGLVVEVEAEGSDSAEVLGPLHHVLREAGVCHDVSELLVPHCVEGSIHVVC